MGKQKVEKSEFDLLDENVQQKQMGTTKEDKEEDIYNLLGTLKLNYSTRKTKNDKVNFSISLQNKEQLMMLLNNVAKIQSALGTNEYITIPIAQRHPYNLVLVVTKTSIIAKISYLSGFIKGTNMSIPVSQSSISSLIQILNALTNSELGKKLLSISSLNNTSQNTENLLWGGKNWYKNLDNKSIHTYIHTLHSTDFSAIIVLENVEKNVHAKWDH